MLNFECQAILRLVPPGAALIEKDRRILTK
jgi:hypothetical protein